ncbi:hypothetical protein HDU83_003125 [Entophlyctis luteolus]|nr:hypothetical protein HDU83_003125 [Entophlyctis luteolus]KAJ3388765.1 hypothetical protein HDU84_009461 [Entophlyctis sp. JEL0112]
MPKIVSSSIVSASKDDDDASSRMNVYFCLCGEFLMILDIAIDRLPRRPVDGAYVLNTKKRTYKLNSVFSKTVVVRRRQANTDNDERPSNLAATDPTAVAAGSDGAHERPSQQTRFERQHRHVCPKCGLLVAYDQKGSFLYVVDGALVAK